jgi:tRNA(adenine34) deaminase
MIRNHEYFMKAALDEARRAFEEDEVPVGCVIVQQGRIIAKAHNQVERLSDPTAHAEMLALTSAASYAGSKWLQQGSVYVTIEPCSMCAGALVLARVRHIYYGAADPKTGACGSCFNIAHNAKLNHRITVQGGVKQVECAALVSEFFRKKREKRQD